MSFRQSFCGHQKLEKLVQTAESDVSEVNISNKLYFGERQAGNYRPDTAALSRLGKMAVVTPQR